MHFRKLHHSEKNAVLKWLRERGWIIQQSPWYATPTAVAPGCISGALGLVDIEHAVLAQVAHEATTVILPTRILE
jgi:hypothetical protein